MKHLILMNLVVLGSSSVFAKDLTFTDMVKVLPNMERAGTQGKNYKCSVNTEWLANGDLKVVATQQYKDWDPSTMEIVLTAAKDVKVYMDKYDDTIDYNISQSTLLKEEDDYRVDLYESLSFNVENDVITSFQVQIAEVDHENDPHEDSIYCNLTK